ncbi:hypothetical protein HYPSUDRAFT_45568 [Hypholoma sublateritium FD-334 SS-4]|uniref:Uncharacterized protein n=1 Tax=Hypholoma sublateritium (strain FD-334 SS-4) TaxID=945553 RepID=A0A0D2NGN1_HYPSF|nr:hypothetical protein HYPSUDRAFT_45568 [Hypholoma sublateritium FD-334 SS-4]
MLNGTESEFSLSFSSFFFPLFGLFMSPLSKHSFAFVGWTDMDFSHIALCTGTRLHHDDTSHDFNRIPHHHVRQNQAIMPKPQQSEGTGQ